MNKLITTIRSWVMQPQFNFFDIVLAILATVTATTTNTDVAVLMAGIAIIYLFTPTKDT